VQPLVLPLEQELGQPLVLLLE
jgi:hypothetical protein